VCRWGGSLIISKRGCVQVGMIPEKVDATINKKREREARLEVERQVLPNRSPNSEQGISSCIMYSKKLAINIF
jgi:hypothetical protein